MAATTVTGQEILWKIAEDTAEIKSGYLTAATSTTQIASVGLSHDTADTYKYGLARILGKGISVIQSSSTVGAFVVSPAFSASPAIGDVLEIAWWQGRKTGEAIDAINEAIRISYPYWYEEIIVDQSAAANTLSSTTDRYALPTDCDALIAVGIQLSSSRPITWFGPFNNKRKTWSVEGQRGDYYVRFHPRFSRLAFNEVYSGKKLCLWYATKEPELTALKSTGGTTQLPLAYFAIASEILRRRQLNDASGQRELQVASVNLPQLQQSAQAELQRLQIGKRPPNLIMLTQQYDNALEIGLAMGMTTEEIAAQQPRQSSGKR